MYLEVKLGLAGTRSRHRSDLNLKYHILGVIIDEEDLPLTLEPNSKPFASRLRSYTLWVHIMVHAIVFI
jgi:hypothetical protein